MTGWKHFGLAAALSVAISSMALAQSYTVTTFAGPYPGENPAFAPYRLAVDGSGNVYVTDSMVPRLQKITPAGVRSTIATDPSYGYVGLAVNRVGDVFVTNFGGIRRINADGTLRTILPGNQGPGPPGPGQFSSGAAAVDSGGTLFVVDGARTIRIVSPDGSVSGFYDLDPSSSEVITSLALDAAGNVFVPVTNRSNGTIRKITPAGLATTVVDLSELGISADEVAVDGAGNIYFSTRYRVCKVTPAGVLSGVVVLQNGTTYTGDRVSIAVDATGNVFIGAYDRILKASPAVPSSPATRCGSGPAPAYTISTYAGGPPPLPARGTLATAQAVASPHAVATAPGGGFFVASRDENRIYRVERSGTVSVVAGTGISGFSGDGGPATSAELYYPSGVAADAAGNLFIADSANNRIRKVNTSGVISTVAGTGTPGIAGDGGPAIAAQLGFPTGIAADATGSLFVGNGIFVRKISRDGIITAFAGNQPSPFTPSSATLGDGGPATAALLRSTEYLAVDRSGNLFISDSANNRIRRVDAATGVIRTIAGGAGNADNIGDGGQATAAYLSNPQGIAVDNAGNLFIADGRRVRRVSPSGVITTFAGNGAYSFGGDGGQATAAAIAPQGLAMDDAGNLLIADGDNHRVRRVASSGIINTLLGNGTAHFSGDGGPAKVAEISVPEGLAVDAAGNLFIADRENARIRKVTPAGVITTVAGSGQSNRGPLEAETAGDGGPATSARIVQPGGVAVDAAGNMYISAQYAPGIRKVAPNGTITTVPGTQSLRAERITVDAAGNLYIADSSILTPRVLKLTPAGVLSTVAGNGTFGFSGDGGPARAAQLKSVKGLAVDSAGNLFIADSDNNRIRKVYPDGTIITVAGTEGYVADENGMPAISAHLVSPNAIAVDSAGNLFIADYQHFQVRMVTLDGKIWTIAGTSGNGFSGDGGPATKAVIGPARGIAVDRSGNIYLSDASGRIRKLTPATRPVNTGQANNLRLLSPTFGEALSQNQQNIGCPADADRGYGNELRFQWEPVNGAIRYHLVVQRSGSTFAVIDTITETTSFTRKDCNSFVVDGNLTGWQWRVEALDENYRPIVVSESRPFELQPCRLTDGRSCSSR